MTTGGNRFFTMLATTGLVVGVLMVRSFLHSSPMPAASLPVPPEQAAEGRFEERISIQPTILKPQSLEDEGRLMSSPRQQDEPPGYREYVGDGATANPLPSLPVQYPTAPSWNLLQGP